MNEYLNSIEISGITYELVTSGGTGSGVTPAEVQEMIEDYTYDKQTIDDKVASGGSESIQILSGDVKTISGDVITLSGDVISLSGDVQNLATDIIALSAETNALETKIDTLSGNVYTKSETSGKTELDAEFAKYYKKDETSSKTEIDDALELKQDKLVAGSGITISGNVISTSGSALNVPIDNGNGTRSIIYNDLNNNTANGVVSNAFGYDSHAEGNYAVSFGQRSTANGADSLVGGLSSKTDGDVSVAIGYNLETTNLGEAAFGRYNKSNKNTSKPSQNTLMSVGYGYDGGSEIVRMNAFEVRTNGDIYIDKNPLSLTRDFIKLQDYLIDTNDYYNKQEIDNKIADVSGDSTSISGDVISLSGDVQNLATDIITLSAETNALETKLDTLSGNVYTKSETSGKTELETEFAKYYQKDETSSKTEIDDALALKVNVVDNQVPEYGLMDKLVEEEGRVKVIYTADSYSNGAVYFYGMAISMGSLPGWRYDVIVVDKNDNVVFSGASAWGHDTVENDYFKLSGYYEHPDDYYLEATIEAKNGYRFTRVGNPSGAGELGNSYTLKYYTQVTKFDSYQSSSAITYNIYPELDKIEREKQDKLTAGSGITISGNVISATGGDTPVDAYTKAESDAKFATITNFDTHSGDTTVHITAQERTDWNAKPDVWCGSEAQWSQISGSTENGVIYLVY